MTTAQTPEQLDGHYQREPIVERRHLDRAIAELVSNGSIELTIRQAEIAEAADLLPSGTSVYVPSPPHRTLMGKLEQMRALRAAGYDPTPHLAARRIPSRQALRQFLDRAVQECGVHRVLLIGGDPTEPTGPYADARALLRDGALSEAGISEVGLAGYPEGHPRIPSQALETALNDKLELAASQGLGAYVLTQFSFAPTRVVDYCARLARTNPDVAVYVGVPGPSNPAQLIRYARICGVSASLRAMMDYGFKAARLLSHTAPNEQLVVLGRYCASRRACNVVGVHVFSFGGFVAAAQWMYRMDTASERASEPQPSQGA